MDNFPASISNSLYTQLAAFQHTIDGRAPEACYPSDKELLLQTKLITNIIRIKKHNAVDHVAKVMKKFIKHLAATDKQLALIIADEFAYFSKQPSFVNIVDEMNTAVKECEQQEALTVNKDGHEPPLTEDQYNRCKSYLANVNKVDKDKMYNVDGKNYKKNWLEYNLFQYTLPVAHRKFIFSQDLYEKYVDHGIIIQLINMHLGNLPG